MREIRYRDMPPEFIIRYRPQMEYEARHARYTRVFYIRLIPMVRAALIDLSSAIAVEGDSIVIDYITVRVGWWRHADGREDLILEPDGPDDLRRVAEHGLELLRDKMDNLECQRMQEDFETMHRLSAYLPHTGPHITEDFLLD